MNNIYIILTLIIISASSCSSVNQIGKVNMISNRNVNPNLEYNAITTYSGGSKKELKKSRAISVEDAVDQTVRKIPGGEFIMNAKLYSINNKYFAVEGDVWGKETELSYRGFKVGDKIIIDKAFNAIAVIKSLKDDKTCFVERNDGKIVEIKYDRISKAE